MTTPACNECGAPLTCERCESCDAHCTFRDPLLCAAEVYVRVERAAADPGWKGHPPTEMIERIAEARADLIRAASVAGN